MNLNLGSLITAFVQPLIQKSIQKSLKKMGSWAVRQDEGKDKGKATLASNDGLLDAVSGAAASSLAQVGAAHLVGDALAKQIGVSTTEEGLVAAAATIASGQSTLNVSDQSALTSFLEQRLIR